MLRYLGLPLNGGSHAHLRRRIDTLGIDTAHFLGRAHNRGRRSPRRLRPDEVLVLRATDRRRAHPEVLRRALVESGVPATCQLCGIGPVWNGRPLTLHVDHVNGEFWDCRPDNLRFLCPNCHSQTPTYAGRNRRPTRGSAEDSVRYGSTRGDRPDDDTVRDIVERVARGHLTVVAAARLIGCHRNHFYRLRRRLLEAGSLTTMRGGSRPRTEAQQDRVIAHALAHPTDGPKAIARQLRTLDPTGAVSHGTVSNILRKAGLNTIAARRSRLLASAGVA
ncbi:helix-turn-helix domain-containing protein [Polymorphospora rubra]|uniref:HNH endonuclease n=1 Tax=Polymorphospora rubra TaxID=338584 RepID=A0A810MXW3_9ACTN|nr:helix-turn-helix domain-containing protein [Polymorphospora rubra]BCJ64188.1 hypothetical protein Prubr_12090 [Polymorphospora rubra]